jgi:FkbM family methyltransferase
MRSSVRIPLTLLLVACSKHHHAPPPPPIDSKPRVLHDEAEIEKYISEFPADQYKIATIDGTETRFYIDTTNDVIKRVLARGKHWEVDRVPLFERCIHAGDYVLDVGAHIGTSTIDLSAIVGDDGHVYSFEPQKKIYRELVMNLRLDHITNATPLRFAIGDGDPRIVHMEPPAKGNEGGTSVGEGGDPVELRTLDSFGFSRIAFMKIDVEGYEDHVLDGATALIAAQHPKIFIEIQGGHDYGATTPEYRAKIDATKAKLDALGYNVRLFGASDYLAVPKTAPASDTCR